jgi:hypothetical protein
VERTLYAFLPGQALQVAELAASPVEQGAIGAIGDRVDGAGRQANEVLRAAPEPRLHDAPGLCR